MTTVLPKPKLIPAKVDALAIINSPTCYAGNLKLRILTWAARKTQRGQTLRLTLQENKPRTYDFLTRDGAT